MTDISKPLENIFFEVSELVATRCKSQTRSVIEYIGHRHKRFQYDDINLLNNSINNNNISDNMSLNKNSNSSYNNSNSNSNSNTMSRQMIGSINYDTNFESTRLDMLNQLQTQVSEIMNNYNHEQEIDTLTQKITNTYFQSASLQGVSAVSLGALLTIQMLDLTGIAFLSTSALMSLLLIPNQKNNFKVQFQSKMNNLQQVCLCVCVFCIVILIFYI